MSDRELVRGVVARGVHQAVPLGVWGSDPEYTKDCYYQADAILAEIEAAGYVLMERGRVERLIAGARVARNMCMTNDDGWMCKFPEVLESDLDPLEGGE